MNEVIRQDLKRVVSDFLSGNAKSLPKILKILTRSARVAPNRLGALSSFHDKITPTGNAIAPQTAIDCISDKVRTGRFIQAINQALQELITKFNSEKIHILYAGCGPLAPLVLPLLTQYSPEQVEVTLVDLHQASLNCVKDLLNELNLNDYLYQILCEDAATLTLKPKPHLIVTEVMAHGLRGEPQYAVSKNLGSQLRPGGIFIPDNITIRAYLGPTEDDFEAHSSHYYSPQTEHRVEIGPIFELKGKDTTSLNTSLPLPQFPSDDTYQVYLGTIVGIYKSFKLEEGESWITRPYPTGLFVYNREASKIIFFQYILGRDPHFELRL